MVGQKTLQLAHAAGKSLATHRGPRPGRGVWKGRVTIPDAFYEPWTERISWLTTLQEWLPKIAARMWHGKSMEFQMVPGCYCFTVTVAISELSIHIVAATLGSQEGGVFERGVRT